MSDPVFDVFLSHSSADKPVVEALAWALRQAGLRPWLDRWELRAGGRWLREVEAALKASASVAVCIGPAGMGRVHEEEQDVALNLAREGDTRVFAVLLPDSGERPEVSEFLKNRTWIDLRKLPFPAASELRKLFADQGLAFAGRPVLQLDAGENPFRGLRPFEEEHARWFFGRDGAIQRVLAAFRERRLVTVTGASGSGKSSLVRAGVVPAVRTGGLDGTRRWRVLVLTPKARPCHSLAQELLRLVPDLKPGDVDAELKRLAESLKKSATALGNTAAHYLERGESLLLVVDQFEECWTLARDEEERRGLIDNLLDATASDAGRLAVALTLRADFFGHCLEHPGLRERIKSSLEVIPSLTRQALREAIDRPAQRVALHVDEAVASDLVESVEGKPGDLPLLQFTLDKLWQGRAKYGGGITWKAYDDMGKLRKALATHADDVIARLDKQGKGDLARRAFLGLVEAGQGSEYTRRRASKDELVWLEPGSVPEVLEELVGERLVTVDSSGVKAAAAAAANGTVTAGAEPAPRESGATYEVSHEALIREWPKLAGWIEQARPELKLRRELEFSVERWQGTAGTGNDESHLWTDERLKAAVRLRDRRVLPLGAGTRDFIAASEKASGRSWIGRVAAGVAALAVVAAAVWLGYPAYRREADLTTLRRLVSDLERFEGNPMAADLGQLRDCKEDIDDFERHRAPAYGDASGKPGARGEISRLLRHVRAERPGRALVESAGAAFDARWAEATGKIKESSRYGGLEIRRQPGLVPLGEGPVPPGEEHGLWEFAHLPTGKEPARHDGKVVQTADMAVVLVLLPGGKYWRGAQQEGEHNVDPGAGYDEGPVREVTVPAFFLSKYEMTQAQWLRLTGRYPSDHQAPAVESRVRPVESVSWNDGREVSEKVGLQLPSEAEWEYGARAGTETPYSFSGGEEELGKHAWYGANAGGTTHPVGEKLPNRFGLHDMHGNVWEWCQDAYAGSYADAPADGSVYDPTGAPDRVFRGGSFRSVAWFCRSAIRGVDSPGFADGDLGLRPARSLSR